MDNHRNRQFNIQVLFVLSTLILVGKALHLQLLDSTFQQKASTAAVEPYTKYPSRGLIYDRHHKLLVANNPMYDLLVTYSQVDKNIDTAKFCKLLGITKEDFVKNLEKNWKSGRFSKSVPYVFLSKIPARTFTTFRESLHEFPGFEEQLRNAREYPEPVAAHLLGYIREVNQREVTEQEELYAPGDYIGASGLEKAYEEELRGTKGINFILKSNFGRKVGAYKNGEQDVAAVSGADLVTTIDRDLQAYAEMLLHNKRGCIVAIEPQTGGILAMVSTPTYDPNLLTITNNKRGATYDTLQKDPNKPLFNRAMMAQYPPGSTMKPVLALIGMQLGTWSVDRGVPCSGGYFSGGQRLTGCHHHAYCGDVTTAIQHSCNAYFVSVFRSIVDKYGFYSPQRGMDSLNHYLDAFGFGHKLGVDFPGEQRGNYPTSKYFNEWYKEDRWNSVWIRSLGIGQGEYLATNLQLANAAAAIGNRGWYYTPHIAKRFESRRINVPEKYRVKHLTGINNRFFDPVIDGMERVTIAGTARASFIPDIPICGKTGTAENNKGEDHSIFFCFAPKVNPKIAIAVYLENSGFGGTYAAPISSLLIEKYLKKSIRSEARKALEKRMLNADLIAKAPKP